MAKLPTTPAPALLAESTLVADYGNFNNGAGPFWGYGSRLLVREGETLFAALAELDPTVKPLCNTRWTLWRRPDGGPWARVAAAPTANEREPCLLARLPGQCLLLSTNPAVRIRSTMADGRLAADCQPALLEFASTAPERAPRQQVPPWEPNWRFTEHSYRTLAVDPHQGTVFLAHQTYSQAVKDYGHAYLLRDAAGQWRQPGFLQFPMRGCYQQAALRQEALHVLAVSDEVEPVSAWREHKRAVTGNEWDYEFRQLFYTYTPDLAARPWSPTLTIDSRDATCGYIRNLDLWLDAAGDAWVLYLDRNVWHRFMRDKFWPKLPLTVALKLAKIQRGRVVERHTLAEASEPRVGEPMRGPQVTHALFHAAPGGRLVVVWHQAGARPGNYLMPLLPTPGRAVRLPLRRPLALFQTVSERAGTLPTHRLDLLGQPAATRMLRHAQFQLPEA